MADRVGLSREEIGRAVWVVEPGGRRFEGAAAISRVLIELGGVWTVPGSFYFVPPLRWLEDRYYARVARKRAWW